jgi:hypothetical protein
VNIEATIPFVHPQPNSLGELLMSATATMNGKPQRKQLADQLDRLDSIIDALADVLPNTVADACREGARLAVKDAILEIIGNPELRALLVPAPIMPPPTPAPAYEIPTTPPQPRPGWWSRLKGKITAAKEAVVEAAVKAKESVVGRCKSARDSVVAVGDATGEPVPVKQISMVAVGAAVVVGVACLVTPHAVAAVVGAVGAATTAVAVQTGCWLRRAARRFGLVN